MSRPRVLLVGVNARSIQANPALYSLRRAAARQGMGDMLRIYEYALHTPHQQILAELYEAQPDIIAFSLYVWNARMIISLIGDLRRVMPRLKIIAGGPEATARGSHYLRHLPADAICIGEGEESFCAWLCALAERGLSAAGDQPLPVTPGFLVAGAEESYCPAPLPDMAALSFPYDEETAAYLRGQAKLVYYEASRGCPHHCSFCASARQKLRERPLELVFPELARLAEIGGQIKFIDRTFNADPGRAIVITREILRLHRQGLSWHFEVSPFDLPEELLALWCDAPKGYFHLEIGVQTLTPAALRAVGRRGEWSAAEPQVRRLINSRGSHVHLDLIAGLPGDTRRGFEQSFHRLHQLNADYLQFGFLKVLPGSPLAGQAAELGLIFSGEPPYQVLATPDMSPADLFALHRAERAFNALYNKTRDFRDSLLDLAEQSGNALRIYDRAADLMQWRGLNRGEAAALVQRLANENSGRE
ncbi:MAG: B12-binding domain-containing radical SAM protein [Clostridia bacterium]|nr:B12-binding domain-containing radical SAM protein [Clostridia bacterium]